MGNLTLRPYQIEAVAKVRQEGFRQYKRVCFCLPTGGGKTVIFSHIIEKAAEKGSRTVVLAHRKEIASQISKTLTRIGVEHGRIVAGQPIPADPIRVASVQTLARQIEKGFKLEVDFIIVDECHQVVADTWLKVIEAAGPDCYVLGVTAKGRQSTSRGLAKSQPRARSNTSPRQTRSYSPTPPAVRQLARVELKETVAVAAKPPLNKVPADEDFDPALRDVFRWTSDQSFQVRLGAVLGKYYVSYEPRGVDGVTEFATTFAPVKATVGDQSVPGRVAMLFSFPYNKDSAGLSIRVRTLAQEGRPKSARRACPWIRSSATELQALVRNKVSNPLWMF
jgi:Type III restriction enzyme, res subunit